MAYQYQFNPPSSQTQQHLPLLDHQNSPTVILHSFANAVFNHLDHYHQPKATQLLEPQKMKVLVAMMAPPEQILMTLQCSFLVFNTTYLAFSVETVFTTHGACMTRSGFITFLRSEIMSDPDVAFKDFSSVSQAMRLGVVFSRSQFPRVADPKAKSTSAFVQENVSKALQDMAWTPSASASRSRQQQDMARLQHQEGENILSRMRMQLADNQIARSAASAEAMGRIGTGRCYRCGEYNCYC
ncbi:hypothetical protein BGZ68_002224 [Mortierella alpina]|nr:hypothetical protein BGZ68_002224 [Mortierella alpina]